ncbi:MAG: 2Fe-2S iron-sulfur cluster binding domain-containing protein [Planctomycetes bacterium]|jgi:NADH-quinone oxidoreductase subunit G|nr:[FeFe] hydrogenase, group A [Phycisphaerae bacterium]NBB95572.1 2Fe-2S iron-sulfur cluster binding domain-containing protein [Planctomycetota bacterium]
MAKVTINGIEVHAEDGQTILDAARLAQVRIPTLCKHPDLPPTASCGVCVVKIAGQRGMVRACTTPVRDGMEIITQDPEIADVRRTVVKLILSNHPNACLTCGRNGTCELQALASEFGIRRETFPNIVADLPRDPSTGAIELEPAKCIKCGRCVMVCQTNQDVWALSFLDRGIDTRISAAGDIQLAESPCIRCGQCSAHCPTGAIFEYSQTEQVWDMLMDPEVHCIAQIAPAVRVSIGEAFGYDPGTNLTSKLYAALRRLGFAAIFDTNFGADVTIMEEATEFARRLENGKGPMPLITTCCPSWVDFMEKFHSDMIRYFSSCKSPHAILGTLAKTYYAEQVGLDRDKIRMVSIMPCTSKKYEIIRSDEMFASGSQDVDIAITTRELTRMIQQAGIELANLPAEQADNPLGEYSGAGTIFGTTGGVMEAALRSAYYFINGKELDDVDFKQVRGLDGVREAEVDIDGRTIRLAVAHGLANVEYVLNNIRATAEAGDEPAYHLVEVMACPGGCIGGGGQSWGVTDEIRQKRIDGLHGDDLAHTIRRSHQNPAVQRLYDDFIGKPMGDRAHQLLHTSYTARPEYRR